VQKAGRTYFLALQVGQVAQVVLPSSQHFIPQAASFLVSHLPQQAQPVIRVAMQASAAQRVRSFAIFMIRVRFVTRLERFHWRDAAQL